MPNLELINKPFDDANALHDVLSYVFKKSVIYGGLAIDPEYAEYQMRLVKSVFHKNDGRQVRHFIVSFSDNDNITLEEAYALAFHVAQYYGRTYQIIFGIHCNTDHIHIHFAFNTVSYVDGRMYAEGYQDYNNLKQHIEKIFYKAS